MRCNNFVFLHKKAVHTDMTIIIMNEFYFMEEKPPSIRFIGLYG
jgi:hypothetical protein